MNITTGDLTDNWKYDNLTGDWKSSEKFTLPIDRKDMTSKQKKNMKVSKHDNKSKLGILRQNSIKKIGRNNPCPCGSGIKFKKCCLNSNNGE